MGASLVVSALIGPVAMTVVAVIAQLAAAGRLRVNHFAGIRIPATLASESAWRAGHRAAVLPAWCSTVVLLIAGGGALAAGGPAEVLAPVLVTLLVVALVVVVIAASRGARAAA